MESTESDCSESDGPEPDRSDAECSEPDCSATAAVRLHVPWDENRAVCAAHGRVLAQQDGVVAEPLSDAEGEWP